MKTVKLKTEHVILMFSLGCLALYFLTDRNPDPVGDILRLLSSITG